MKRWLVPCGIALLSFATHAQGLSVEQQVERAHPGWRDTVGQPEFRRWLDRQKPDLKRLADSNRPADAIRLLDAFKRDAKGLVAAAVGRKSGTDAKPATPSDPMRVLPPWPSVKSDQPMKPQELFSAISPSVVVVEAELRSGASQGSGVIVGEHLTFKNGATAWLPMVVTNAHVVADAETVKLKHRSALRQGSVVYRDPSIDLALVLMESTPNTRRVGLKAASKLEVGESVFAIGSPLGQENSLSTGVVSSLRKIEGQLFIQTSAPISPGSSGGGLFDDKGRLVGITTFKLRGGENLNFAVDGETVFDLRGAYYAWDELVFTLGFDKLSEAENKGDILRWLWRSRDPVTGRQRYLEALDITGKMNNALMEQRPIDNDLRDAAAKLLADMNAEVSAYPKPTRYEVSGDLEYQCTTRSTEGDAQPFTYPVVVNRKEGWVEDAGMRLPITVTGNNVEWDQKGLKWIFGLTERRIVALVTNVRGWRAGETMFTGNCRPSE